MHPILARCALVGLLTLASTAVLAQSRLTAPAPHAKESFQSYCARLERQAQTIRFRCALEMDWLDPARPTVTRRIEFATNDFARVFEIARALHGIPASLRIPAQGPAEQTVVDPKKPAYLWTSELAIRRTASGQLERVDYTARSDGGGSAVRVQRKDPGLVAIESGAFGD
jgi:hypothetical protein